MTRLRTWLRSHRRVRRILWCMSSLACAAFVTFAALWHAYPFPLDRLDASPPSPLVTDRTGRILLATIAPDEQLRFPVPLARTSPWLRLATIAVEDERFYSHPGVDPLAVVRAVAQNLGAMRTISGASTLTMQLCRMMDDRPRTLASKSVEAFRALQLERLRTKDQILEAYLNTAPYGGNLSGVEAAAIAWFGKHATDLSLGEAALLAGIPQSPTRLRPDRHESAARARRSHVLARMRERGMISAEQATAADAEPICLVPASRRPVVAPHAAFLALARRPQGGCTTIDPRTQSDVERRVREHLPSLPPGTQVAAVVVSVPTGEILALVGSAHPGDSAEGQVNGALARRSPGSVLKPFIYATAFEAGVLADDSTVYDVPIMRAGWSPSNFDGDYAGRLSTGEALRRSLNVPAILVAEAVGMPRCLGVLEAAGVRLPSDVQARGGLSVVTGGVEVTLLDVVTAYATLGRGGRYLPTHLFLDELVPDPAQTPPGATTGAAGTPVLDRDVCAMIDDILSSRRRCPRGMESRDARDVPWFMWKTGTSSARRDAWAVGHNRRFAIGVWVGRFAGGGSPHFVGAGAAEPLLASLFDLPAVRQMQDPPAPPRRPPTRPLAPPPELAAEPRILAPAARATFVAMDGRAVVPVRASLAPDLTWFLNGAVLPDAPDRLTLAPGTYELRCASDTGLASAVTFSVVRQ